MLSAIHENAAGFTYSRYNTELKSSKNYKLKLFLDQQPNDFSLIRSISNARIVNEWEDGKYVVNTSRVETAWLHYPGIKQKKMIMYNIPDRVNIMVHLRNWTMLTKRVDDEDPILKV